MREKSAVVEYLSSNCRDLFIDVISQKTVPCVRMELLKNVGNYFASCGSPFHGTTAYLHIV